MPHNAAFQMRHFIRIFSFAIFRERNTCFGIKSCDPSIYTMNHSDFIVCIFTENSIGLRRIKKSNILSGIVRRRNECAYTMLYVKLIDVITDVQCKASNKGPYCLFVCLLTDWLAGWLAGLFVCLFVYFLSYYSLADLIRAFSNN